MSFFKLSPKLDISPQFITGILSGMVAIIGVVSSVVVKAFTKHHITDKEAEKKYQTIKLSDEKDRNLGRSIDTLRDTMDSRFNSVDNQMNVIITLIKKNGR